MASVSIERVVYVSLGGKLSWKIKRPFDIEGLQFVKFEPRDTSLVRFVCEGILPRGELRKNASLTHCPGLKELIKIRNEAALERFQPQGPTCQLFGSSGAAVRKHKRRSAGDLKEKRINREVFDVMLPAFGERAQLMVRMIAPVSPRDDLTVELTEVALDHVFGYIKHSGILGDDINNKRSYKSEPVPAGVWKTKQGFTIRLPSKRYRRAKTVEEAVAIATEDPAPLCDATDPALQ